MTRLRFWPFDGVRRRREKESHQAHNLLLAELRDSFDEARVTRAQDPVKIGEDVRLLQPDEPIPCHKCGGLFLRLHMTNLLRIVIFQPPSGDRPPHINEVPHCERCLPNVDVEVTLKTNVPVGSPSRQKDGMELDKVLFSTSEGWLQPFSFDGAEDFGLLYCSDCDALVHPNKQRQCSKCAKPKRRR